MLHKNLVPSPINAHAESLPLASNSIDIIISNLMLQWPENKRQALAETHRVLKPGGKLIFTTLIQPSLHELITSWAQIDEAKHTLSFLMPEDYLSLCHQARLGILAQSLWHETLFFSNFIELCRHFKDSGTSLPYAKRRGLGGKDALRRIEQLYPHRARGLPLSYHYLMLVLHKEA
jgi:malonyl-CoA O-methyltransferase